MILPDNIRIARGYGDRGERSFLPDREITRFELLKLSLLSSCISLLGDEVDVSASFSDVPLQHRESESEDRRLRRRVIITAVKHNIIEGYDDGTFRPDDPVNRAEALKILLLATGVTPLEDEDTTEREFSDVPSDSWFSPYIERAVALDFIEGYEDGTFRPGQSITRAEASKLVFYLLLSNPRVNGYVIPSEGI
jgi:hypothetical protein